MRLRKVTVKKHPDRTRPKRWQVRYLDHDGKRHFKFFLTEGEATVYAEIKRTELTNEGSKALSLSDKVRQEAAQAMVLLEPFGKGVMDAARFYARHLESTAKSCPVETLVEKFLWAKEAEGVSKGHLKTMGIHLNSFQKAFAGRIVATIEPHELTSYLRTLPGKAVTRLGYQRSLRNLFGFAVHERLTPVNPAKEVRLPKAKETVIEVFTVTEIARLLAAADELTLPFIAIGAFAGLRSAEIGRLKWENIKFDQGIIEITAEVAKTGQRRIIPIQDNLRAWLLPLAQESGPVVSYSCQKTFYGRIHKVCDRTIKGKTESEKTKRVQWKHNALRHSYGSYRSAQTQNVAQVSLEMGNSPRMVFKHYRELVSPKEAKGYWEVVPTSMRKGKITPFKAA